LRKQNFAASWPDDDDIKAFNWLRVGVMAITFDLQHLLRNDVLDNIRGIHDWRCAHQLLQIFSDIRLANKFDNGPALQTTRAQPPSMEEFFDLCAI
jgi:hypothetical protein